jgi:hypothetical protein
MPPRPHLTTAASRGVAAVTPRSPRARLTLVADRDLDDREAAARAASMARHPAGNRARALAEQRAASMAHHPAGGTRRPLR